MTDLPTLEQWIEALESGKYPQATDGLCMLNDDGEVEGFCCLGVYCEIAGFEKRIKPTNTWYTEYKMPDGSWLCSSLSGAVDRHIVGANTTAIDHVMRMNDREYKSFRQIARYLRGLKKEQIND